VKIKGFSWELTILIILLLLVSYQCAQIGSISGGPRDMDPPKMLGSKPKMFATDFKGKKVSIEFDEYLQLKDVNQQFNVSPPFKKKPKVWLKNKNVVIEYSDTLRDSTTYTFSFGNSLSDNNEGNLLPNFEFAFSTGNHLDSMVVRGRIVDAFTHVPDKESLLAMLYGNLADSAPYKEAPLFTSRADKDGYYSINNVKPGVYKLYALKDANFNYKYNPGAEQFAFNDTVIVINPEYISNLKQKPYWFRPDTANKAKKHTLNKSKNKIVKKKTKVEVDSVELVRRRNSIFVDMFTFKETDKKQYLKDYSRKERRLLKLVFNNPLKDDSLEIKLKYYSVKNWFQLEQNRGRDSISLWITDSTIYKSDTLKTILSYWKTNKIGDTVWFKDTINLKYSNPDGNSKKLKKAKVEKMKIKWTNGSVVDLNSDPVIETEYPIVDFDKLKFKLTQHVDTIDTVRNFSIIRDNLNNRRFKIIYPWDEQSNYKLTIYPGAFKNLYNVGSDTIKIPFSTQKLDYYGKLILNIEGIKSHAIVQLLENDKVLYEKYAEPDGKVTFDYIQPKSYNLKLIEDTNNNKKWDSGDFKHGIQPETVYFYKGKLNIRSNWDVDISWSIE